MDAFLLFHETEAVGRAWAAPWIVPLVATSTLPLLVLKLCGKRPPFSHGGLEGLEGWWDAQQGLIRSCEGPGTAQG